jgi:PAS domain S-box-containing protein
MTVKYTFFKNRSIANKLIILFLLLGIGSTVLVGVYSYFSAKHSLTERTFDQLTSIRVAKKKRIESFFADRFRDINMFAKTAEVSKMLDNLKKFHKNSATSRDTIIGEYASFLNTYIVSYGYYEKFIVADESGKMLYTSISADDSLNKFSLDTIETHSLKTLWKCVNDSARAVFKDFRNDSFNSDKPAYYIAAPLYAGTDEIKGMIALQVSFDAINSIMLESSSDNGLGETGESYLVGDDYLMRSTSRFKPNSIMVQQVKTKAVLEALKNKKGTEIIQDYRSIDVLSSFSNLDVRGINWAIMAEIDLKEAMVPVQGIRNDIFFLSFILALFIIGFAYVISRSISLPIIRLKNAALRVGEGEFDTRVDVKNTDEIGALAHSFNIMTGRINDASRELREREERLRHFYEATIDGIFLHFEQAPLLVNQALSRMTGFSEAELMKLKLGNILNLQVKQKDNISSQNIRAFETVCLRKDGTSFAVEVQESEIDYQGRLIKATVIRDITLRKKVETELVDERSKRLSALIDGQEIERQRFSRELHDGLGQQLIAIKLKLESISNQQCIDNNETLKQLTELFNSTIEETRRISDNLMPSILKEFGLETALKRLCSDVSISSGMTISFESFGYSDSWGPKAITYLYRISQEALNNVVKHAKATEASVQLIEVGNYLRLIVEDNGKGFNFSDQLTFVGNGLYNMRERVNLLKGVIDIETKPGNGTVITVKIPKDTT